MPAIPYDIVYEAVTMANLRLSGAVETLTPIGGQLVSNSNSYSQQACISAWRKMQNRLADLRFSGLQTDTIFSAVPSAGSTDEAIQAYIGFNGYFDGVTLQGAPVLPQALIRPYELAERITGSGASFIELDDVTWSLPRVPKRQWNGQWLWRNNTIVIPGATTQTDISMLYAQLLPDFADTGNTPWFMQPISILNCLDALADYICREIKIAQGNKEATMAFQASAEDNTLLILNQDTAQGKSIWKQSAYGQMSDRFTPNSGADTQSVKR